MPIIINSPWVIKYGINKYYKYNAPIIYFIRFNNSIK